LRSAWQANTTIQSIIQAGVATRYKSSSTVLLSLGDVEHSAVGDILDVRVHNSADIAAGEMAGGSVSLTFKRCLFAVWEFTHTGVQ
jgi:hypothetical protein